LRRGEAYALHPVLTPSGSTDILTWRSVDAAVAAVSETGVVTGVARGRTEISGVTVGGLRVTCMVTVL
jgi:uncharacterized protein YjdB